ncbi:MAG: ABC transporter permease [Chloroflexi bacterium]|jgi:peptide/nickel transport system permease protein|nr:ABC transporter permease [Chloroflexota bacterium]
MTRYLARRTVQAVPLLLFMTLVVFILLRATPGGPMSMYEADPTVTPEDLARLRAQMGLDQPVPLQYLRWLGAMVSGDWGWSLVTKRPVTVMILERLPNTLLLMSITFVVTLAIAVPIAIVSAVRQYSWFDHVATTIAFAGNSLPTFWIGLMLIMIFAVGLRWLPAGGMYTLGEPYSFGDRLKYLILPVTTLAIFDATHYIRYLRSSLLDVIRQDYIRVAHAKGLDGTTVLRRHALRNAAIPLVTVIAIDLPQLFSGALITETIFAWPGMGRLFWEASGRVDYPVLMGIFTVASTLVIASNLLADVAYAWLDPRIRYR